MAECTKGCGRSFLANNALAVHEKYCQGKQEPPPERPKGDGARNHKPECQCGLCQRIRHQRATAAEKEARGEKVRRYLKPRQRRFAQEFADPDGPGFKNASKSAELAGYSLDSAPAIGAHLLRDEQIQNVIFTALQRKGITWEYMAERLKEGMQATVVSRATYEGKYTDERVDVDHYARHKFVETTMRAMGAFPRDLQVNQAALIVRLPERMSREGWKKRMAKRLPEEGEAKP